MTTIWCKANTAECTYQTYHLCAMFKRPQEANHPPTPHDNLVRPMNSDHQPWNINRTKRPGDWGNGGRLWAMKLIEMLQCSNVSLQLWSRPMKTKGNPFDNIWQVICDKTEVQSFWARLRWRLPTERLACKPNDTVLCWQQRHGFVKQIMTNLVKSSQIQSSLACAIAAAVEEACPAAKSRRDRIPRTKFTQHALPKCSSKLHLWPLPRQPSCWAAQERVLGLFGSLPCKLVTDLSFHLMPRSIVSCAFTQQNRTSPMSAGAKWDLTLGKTESLMSGWIHQTARDEELVSISARTAHGELRRQRSPIASCPNASPHRPQTYQIT